jgi:hypothetical protein
MICWALWGCWPESARRTMMRLSRLGHVQPRAGEWRVERQDAMIKEPIDQVIGQMSGEIIPHQDDA